MLNVNVFEKLKKDKNFLWTKHVIEKMKFYQLSPSRIKRVIRYPERTEQGIVEGAIACMQTNKSVNPAPFMDCALRKKKKPVHKRCGVTRKEEIWTMYSQGPKITIISAWRYPGKSPERDPIPKEILEEVKKLL